MWGPPVSNKAYLQRAYTCEKFYVCHQKAGLGSSCSDIGYFLCCLLDLMVRFQKSCRCSIHGVEWDGGTIGQLVGIRLVPSLPAGKPGPRIARPLLVLILFSSVGKVESRSEDSRRRNSQGTWICSK